MLVGYARASTKKQPIDRQIRELIAFGVDGRNIYKENESGTKRDREKLGQMLDELQPGDVVVFVELSRLSRSLIDLISIVEIIGKKGASFKSLKENLFDTTTTEGKLIFGIFAILAEFERNTISDRTKSGLAAARARGHIGGRPNKQNEKAHLVEMLYDGGMGPMAIFRELDGCISVSTIKRIIRGLREAAAEIDT